MRRRSGTWVADPWNEGLDATWTNVWGLFAQTLGCTLRGHRGTIYASRYDDPPWRTCDRCDRKWRFVADAAGSGGDA